MRLQLLIALFMSLLLMPVWPASASAIPGGDDAFLGKRISPRRAPHQACRETAGWN